jgi:polyisoprenoid-binding protein YceI
MRNNTIMLAFLAGIITYAFLIHTTSCTREDELVGPIDPPMFEYGTETVKSSEGWNFDKTHSSVLWETDYLGVSALLTGRFNAFGATINFDEDNPEVSSFSGYVVLSTVNTGEPGRDAGCLLNTFGVSVSDTARIISKSIEFDNLGGYIARADLHFHGVVKEVLLRLYYTEGTRFDENSGVSGAPYTVAGITGQFEFNALSDFLISSGNISDGIRIKLNCQFKKPG